MISAIFTLSKNHSLGADNSVDWTCSEDKIWFQDVSKKIGVVVMGSNTFKVMQQRPLPERTNYILTSHPENFQASAEVIPLTTADFEKLNLPDYCVVGGYQIYQYFWSKLDVVYVSYHKLVEIEGKKFEPDFSGFKLLEKTESAELIKEIWVKNQTDIIHL
jgi:dihydrofolate reductase